MPPFRDDQIIIIAPGSETTLAQLGLPESFTPAALRIRSRMFPGEKEGEWEPYKVRRRQRPASEQPIATDETTEAKPDADEEPIFEEDLISEEGAVWPIVAGKIVNWSCFYALMSHVYATLNPPFHTPILVIAQPCWTPREHEKITQFFFEKFKMPAFALMDSAIATMYAFGVHTATVVDIGKSKCDITAMTEFLAHDTGRIIGLKDCGGDAMTKRLLELLKPKGFNWDMCEQLKKSTICEILPQGTDLPGAAEQPQEVVTNPAAAASTGAPSSGPEGAAVLGNAPRGPGPDTEVGEEANGEEDNEGVLDVASIVARGNMTEYLARKEREKMEKATKKKGTGGAGDGAPSQPRAVRLPNSKREKNTFLFEDHALLDKLKDMNLSGQKMAEATAALDEGPKEKQDKPVEEANGDAQGADPSGTSNATNGAAPARTGPIRREVEVGTERFQAASGGIIERIADAIHRTISAVEEVSKRSELWECLVICGNGARVRGFKEALMAKLQSKYLISPSSATIFTSELPSNISTPAGTGANTPQPQLGPPHPGSQVNPLLLAATTAQHAHLLHPSSSVPSIHSHSLHSSHGQTPTSIKYAKPPEYFPEWKEVGYDEAVFLGAQVAAKVLFIVDQGIGKGYMTRPDYNESGPQGIHDFSM